jgi:hypothetical protein
LSDFRFGSKADLMPGAGDIGSCSDSGHGVGTSTLSNDLSEALESQAAQEPSAPVAIAVAEADMSQHLTRARLYRSLIGAISTMIVFAAALFTSALHFAG